jgi:hypothetical protein
MSRIGQALEGPRLIHERGRPTAYKTRQTQGRWRRSLGYQEHGSSRLAPQGISNPQEAPLVDEHGEESKKMIKVTEGKLSEVVAELKELVVRSHQRVWIGVNKKTHRSTRERIQVTSIVGRTQQSGSCIVRSKHLTRIPRLSYTTH